MRLDAVLGLLTPCERLVDVGTDHALIPLRAVERGLAAHAYGVDVAMAPIQAARATVAHEPRVTLLHGDGLVPVRHLAPDALVMAGMGAETMREVMKTPTPSLRQVVAQPNTEPVKLRAWMRANGWWLETETLVTERGRTFTTLRFVRADGPDPAYVQAGFTAEELEVLGPWLIHDPAAAPRFQAQIARHLAIDRKTGRPGPWVDAYKRALASAGSSSDKMTAKE